MCGIAGFAGDSSPEVARNTLRAMVDAIAHRGPDGEGIATWPGASLGHRRLAIIDLSDAGRQPMLSDDGEIGIVFNGCIYNFVEIRTELERCGHRFRSHCDTEVLVRGYQQWGIDELVPRLRGMFAFAVWDNPRKTLTLVRDRLGVKPLIWARSGNCIGFASTVTALQSAGMAGDVDPIAVREYLEFGYVTDDRSIFEGVFKVPAAGILEWRNGEVSQRSYWSVPEADDGLRIGFEEAVEETERLLIESVRLRLVADVPIGALLSGGIDSALVCWAVSKLDANITAFTVSTPGDASDEAAAARETAALLGIPHRVVTMAREDPGLLDDLTSAFAEPFGAQSALAMLRVSAAVKPHATVLLTGDGGDDVFLGYEFYRHYQRAQDVARRLPDFATPLWRRLRPLVGAVPAFRRPMHFLDYCTGGLGAVARASHSSRFYEQRAMFGDRLADCQLNQQRVPSSMESARHLLPEFLRYQQRMWFVAHFMTKVDSGTMFHALEARAPFLDHKLWEFAARLSPDLRLQGGVLKALLREIARRRIGPAVATRSKQGFSVPVEHWMAGHWHETLQDAASHSMLERDGWIRRGALQLAAKEVRETGRADYPVWFLVVLEHWMRRHANTAVAPGVFDGMTSVL
jgi:asparagine synthase (glutamine-hydrolysing)